MRAPTLTRCIIPGHQDCEMTVERLSERKQFKVVSSCGAAGPWEFKRPEAVEKWDKLASQLNRE